MNEQESRNNTTAQGSNVNPAKSSKTSPSTGSSRHLSPPVNLANGRKLYTVMGKKFEVLPQYSLHKVIGAGSYGIVCSAVDHQEKVKIAVKMQKFRRSGTTPQVTPPTSLAPSTTATSASNDTNLNAPKKAALGPYCPGDTKRILREIKLMKFFKHENILGLRHFYVSPPSLEHFDQVYSVTELLDADLNTVIKSKQSISETHIKYFVYQILRALKYVHSANVMHRDLKPANCLVNLDCDLKLCDFGLARGLDKTYSSTSGDQEEDPAYFTDYVVTRWYRPPELLLMNRRYDQSVDIWSAACILAELFLRRPLFPGKDYISSLNLICCTVALPPIETIQGFVKNQEAIEYLKTLEIPKPTNISQLIPGMAGNEAAQEFLLSGLCFEPSKRLSASQLMAHPYMKELHDPTDEPEAEAAFQWNCEMREDITEEEFQDLFWAERCTPPPLPVSSPTQPPVNESSTPN